MSYIPTPSSTLNPVWTGRNKKIGEFIPFGKSVLDLGCGSKDLLKYTDPSRYWGIDYNSEEADQHMDFNVDFTLPAGHWDYIVCSGLIEYLKDIEHFIKSLKGHADIYIITLWKNYNKLDDIQNPNHLPTTKDYQRLLEAHFNLVHKDRHAGHNIYILRDKQ